MNRLRKIINTISVILCIPFYSLFGFIKFLTNDIRRYTRLLLHPIQINKCGIPASAQITRVRQSTEWHGSQPILQIQVRFMTQDQQEIIASIQTAVPLHEFHRYQPGKYLDIKYDPENPSEPILRRYNIKDDPSLS